MGGRLINWETTAGVGTGNETCARKEKCRAKYSKITSQKHRAKIRRSLAPKCLMSPKKPALTGAQGDKDLSKKIIER